MLVSTEYLRNYTVLSNEGLELGRIDGYLMRDETLEIQFVLLDLSLEPEERKTIISTAVIEAPDTEKFTIRINLPYEQILNSPDIDTEGPITAEHEQDFHKYYGWPVSWYDDTEQGTVPNSSLTEPDFESDRFGEPVSNEDETEMPSLLSTEEFLGFHVQALNDEIGTVEDFIIEGDDWIIKYIVVNGVNLPRPREVLISTEWISETEWTDGHIYIDLDADIIQNSPDYEQIGHISRDKESEILEYYDHSKYWR